MAIIPRVIPCLLLDQGAFVKTIGFRRRQYIGDPVNVINLFNQFEADEIVLLDIAATPSRRRPQFHLIEELAQECWVPLTYGGGIKALDDIARILRLGVEKVVLNTAIRAEPTLITEAASEFGSQAIVAAVDVKRRLLGGYGVYVNGGRRRVATDLAGHARRLEELGAGELFVNLIDRDGTMKGFDLEPIREVSAAVRIPVVACGGAGERSHLMEAITLGGASAVAAGSIFVYQNRERGVLINFPERDQLERLFT